MDQTTAVDWTDVTAGKADPRVLARQGYCKLSFGSDDQLGVRFFVDAVEVPALGPGQFQDREFIEIRIPGGDVVVRELAAEDPYKARFGAQYKAWKAGQAEPVGTPLEAPFIKPSMKRTLQSIGVETLEQVAALDDHAVQKIGMGGLELRKKALAFLQAQSDADYASRQAEAEKQLQDQNEALRAELEALREMVREVKDGKEKKGRA